MKKSSVIVFMVCGLISFLGAKSVFAQSSISTKKEALIRELLDLTGIKNFNVEQKVSTSNIGDALIKKVEKDKELTDEQRGELKKWVDEGKERLEKQLRDFTADKTLSAQLFEKVSVQEFDKKFTESELSEMVVFYRTPAGQKSAEFLLGFLNQFGKAFSVEFKQKVTDFINQKLDEEFELLEQKIREVKSTKLRT